VVREPLGDRAVLAQPSGGVAEYLQVAEGLAHTASFEPALKDRIARLANFRHSSYARVRRIHHAVDNDGRPVLVAAHVPGRRLITILEASERTQTRPTTSAVLAVTRQLMASVALLHDFGPDIFHGALGPERVVLGADSRVIITDYVLGAAVEQAAVAKGARRLWCDFRIAVLPDPSLPQFGRRTDILQIGLITLATLLGRPLRQADFPDGLEHLFEVATETTPGGAPVSLRPGLRSWLERALFVTPAASFKSLFEAQRAFTRLIQEEGYGASVNAWNAFVEECDAADSRLAAVEVVPEPVPASGAEVPPLTIEPAAAPVRAPQPGVTDEGHAGEASAAGAPLPAGPSLAAVAGDDPTTGSPGPTAETNPASPPPADASPGAEAAPPAPPPVAAVLFQAAPSVTHAEGAEAPAGVQSETPPGPSGLLTVDPFGPWPVAVPSQSAATLLAAFDTVPGPKQTGVDALTSAVAGPAGPAAATSAAPGPEAGAQLRAPEPPQTPYGASRPPSAETTVEVVTVGESTSKSAVEQSRLKPSGVPGMKIDWSLAAGVGALPEVPEEAGPEVAPPEPAVRPVGTSRGDRFVQLLVLLVLTAVAALAIRYGSAAWTYLYEGPRHFGTAVIRSDPPGAIVTVDGLARGKTPVDLTLRAGPHEIELQSGGSASTKMIVVPANGSVSERMLFPNAMERGGLRITTYPTTGRIAIDGVPRGETPLKVSDLTPGGHVLLVETPLGAQEQDVVVEAGKITEVGVPTAAWIRVVAPYDLKVSEDGRVFGTTGNAPVMVPPGSHGFDFANQGLALKLTKFIDVPPGQLVNVPLDLPVGMMNLYADQSAEVWLDGKLVGNTPISSLPTPLGPHEVIFRTRQYGEVRYSVMVTLTAPVSLTVTFRK
jgi:hypothetical protein